MDIEQRATSIEKPPRGFSWLQTNLNLADKRQGKRNSLRAIAIDHASIPLKITPSDNPFLPSPIDQQPTSNAITLAIISPDPNNSLLLSSLPTSDFRYQSSDMERRLPCLLPNAPKCVPSSNEQRATSNDAQLCCAYLWENKETLLKITDLVITDTALSSRFFTEGLLSIGFHLISRFKNDEPLSYLYDGPPTGLRGRPKKYDGKIDFANLDPSKAVPLAINPAHGKAFEMQAWTSSLERSVKLVVHFPPNGSHRIYFSTNESLPGIDIYNLCRARSRFEMSLRDIQNLVRTAPSDENAYLTALNILKARDKRKEVYSHQSSVSSFKG